MEQFVIELIGFVYINSCSISLTFPIAGNLNIRPSSCIKLRFIKILRTVIGILYPMEFPTTVQTHVIRRRFIISVTDIRYGLIRPHISMRGQFVQSDSILALPFGLLLRHYWKYNQSSPKYNNVFLIYLFILSLPHQNKSLPLVRGVHGLQDTLRLL